MGGRPGTPAQVCTGETGLTWCRGPGLGAPGATCPSPWRTTLCPWGLVATWPSAAPLPQPRSLWNTAVASTPGGPANVRGRAGATPGVPRPAVPSRTRPLISRASRVRLPALYAITLRSRHSALLLGPPFSASGPCPTAHTSVGETPGRPHHPASGVQPVRAPPSCGRGPGLAPDQENGEWGKVTGVACELSL